MLIKRDARTIESVDTWPGAWMLNWSRMGVRTEGRTKAALLISTLRQNRID